MLSPYTEYIIELLSPFGNIIAKHMFGGYGIYKDNIIIGIIVEDELYFKVDRTNQTQYEKLGVEPFIYESRGRKIKMSYWKVPLEILEDEERLHSWLDQSYSISLQAKKKNTKSKKRIK